MKKVLSLVLVISLVLGSFAPVFAAENPYAEQAELLKSLNVLKGDENGNLNLDSTLTRQELMVMTARLMGQEKEAENFKFESPFSDVDHPYFEPFIAWAYNEGLTTGYGDGTFGPEDEVTVLQLQIFLLRVLGYEFNWQDAPEIAVEAGIMGDIEADGAATRAVMSALVYNTLEAEMADGSQTLAASLNVEMPKEAVSVATVELGTVANGAELELPETVEVTYDNGTTEEVAVAWDEYDTTVMGTLTIEGTVEGTELVAVATVTVEAPELVVESISAPNYKEVVITFNNELNEDTVVIDNFTGDVDTANDTIALNEDGKSVTITLNSALSAYDAFSVDIADVEDVYGNVVADTTMDIDLVFDIDKPEVESVEAVANNKVKVTFDEPVQGPLSITNFYLDGKLFAGSATVDGRVVTLNLSKRLESDVYELTVRGDKIKDYANLFVAETKESFVVENDTVAPEADFVSATQTELVFMFTEPVTIGNVTIEDGTIDVANSGFESDEMTYKLVVQKSDPVPVNGTTVTFTDVEDGFGNKTDEIEFVIESVEIDIERPEVTSVTVEDQAKIIVEFDENVDITTGTFTVTDANDNNVPVSVAYAKDDDGNDILNVVELSASFAAGEYKVVAEDVEDMSPLANKLVPVTKNVTIEDVTAPAVASIVIDLANNRMLIAFDEEIEAATALDPHNYTYVGTDNITYDLTSDEEVTLLDDGMTVEIQFTNDTADVDTADVTDVKVLQIKSVTDLEANVMTTAAYDSSFWTTTVPGAPAITAAKVTDINTVELTIDKDIIAETLAPTDFTFTAGGTTISVIDAIFNADDMVIEVTVNADLDTAGQYQGNALTLALASDLTTVDVYGNNLTNAVVGNVEDGVKPEATVIEAVYSGPNTVVTIELSEDLNLTDASTPASSEFVVLVDGSVVTIDSLVYNNAVDADTPAKLTFTFNNVDYTDKEMNVKFFGTSSTPFVDAAGNKLPNFDLTDTVE